MKYSLFILFALSIVSIACNKSTTTSEVNIEAKLIGKWNLKTWLSNDGTGSQVTRTASGNYKADEYMQLDAGGQFFIHVDNKTTPTLWKLLNNNKTLYILPVGDLDVPVDGYEIKTLDDHNLVLYYKEITGNSYSEITITLQR